MKWLFQCDVIVRFCYPFRFKFPKLMKRNQTQRISQYDNEWTIETAPQHEMDEQQESISKLKTIGISSNSISKNRNRCKHHQNQINHFHVSTRVRFTPKFIGIRFVIYGWYFHHSAGALLPFHHINHHNVGRVWFIETILGSSKSS